MQRYRRALCAAACLTLLGSFVGRSQSKNSPPAEPYLFGQATFPGPAFASFVASGDFNRDGKLDFVVADREHNAVSVFLATPDGTFTPPVSFATGATPRFIAVGDFDEDGAPDLAVAFGSFAAASGGVSVLLGNGDGSFRTHNDVALSGIPFGVKTADFDGDQHLDLAVVTQDAGGSGASQVPVLLGNGNGTFRSPVVSAASPNGSNPVVADLNGDGKPDLAMTIFAFVDAIGNTASVSILLGKGDGTFETPNDIVFEGQTPPLGLEAGDFNGDHKIDLAFAAAFHGGTNGVAILPGKGDGSFTVTESFPFTFSVSPTGLLAADLNGDGNLDVAVYAQNTVDILPGDGKGGLGRAVEFGIGQGAVSGLSADVNGDFKPDLVFAASGLNVVLGNGDGTFGARRDQHASSSPLGVAAGDFNGDDHPDLVVANADDNTISLLLGAGDGTFSAGQAFPTGERPGSISTGDFNGDGKLDVAVANVSGSSVSVLLGNGDGTFGLPTDYPTGTQPLEVAAGDFNGDGKTDLAVANAGVLYQGNTISVLLGNGDGTFQAQKTTGLSATGPQAIAAADFNHDGRLDLAVTFHGNQSVAILLGDGQGGFEESPGDLVGAQGPIVAADFNGDGTADLAVAVSGGTLILLGHGDGTFEPGQTCPGCSANLAADFNGDGILDLIGVSGFTLSSIATGKGDGTFLPASTLVTGGQTVALAAADFNSDGAVDFAAANFAAFGAPGSVAVFLSTPVAAFGPDPHHAMKESAGRAHQILVLSNPSPAPLEGIQISVTGGAAVHDNCPSSLAPGGSCKISVGFTPGSAADLVVRDNAPGSPQILPLGQPSP